MQSIPASVEAPPPASPPRGICSPLLSTVAGARHAMTKSVIPPCQSIWQIIIPADLSERMRRWGSNWSNHLGPRSPSVSSLAWVLQLRDDLEKFQRANFSFFFLVFFLLLIFASLWQTSRVWRWNSEKTSPAHIWGDNVQELRWNTRSDK